MNGFEASAAVIALEDLTATDTSNPQSRRIRRSSARACASASAPGASKTALPLCRYVRTARNPRPSWRALSASIRRGGGPRHLSRGSSKPGCAYSESGRGQHPAPDGGINNKNSRTGSELRTRQRAPL